MKRVAIFGSPGSGKTTLARQLAARTELPVFHLDRYFFKPDWVIVSESEFNESLRQVITQERWITDGNYLRESVQTGRIERADTLILLNYPRLICLSRFGYCQTNRRNFQSSRSRHPSA